MTMRERIKKYVEEQQIGQHVKAHLKDHKDLYVGIGSGVIVTGIAFYAMSGRSIPADVSTVVNVRSFNFFSKQTVNVITVVKRDGAGHPGYPTLCIETGERFMSQGGAARYAGVSDGVMSGHLKGKLPNLNGLHYEHTNA